MNVLGLTPEQAIAYANDPRNDHAFYVMAANYDPNGEEGEWDGITHEDVVTCTDLDGTVLVDEFAQWGPFQLWFDEDPGPAQPPVEPTPRERIRAILDGWSMSPFLSSEERFGFAELVDWFETHVKED